MWKTIGLGVRWVPVTAPQCGSRKIPILPVSGHSYLWNETGNTCLRRCSVMIYINVFTVTGTWWKVKNITYLYLPFLFYSNPSFHSWIQLILGKSQWKQNSCSPSLSWWSFKCLWMYNLFLSLRCVFPTPKCCVDADKSYFHFWAFSQTSHVSLVWRYNIILKNIARALTIESDCWI